MSPFVSVTIDLILSPLFISSGTRNFTSVFTESSPTPISVASITPSPFLSILSVALTFDAGGTSFVSIFKFEPLSCPFLSTKFTAISIGLPFGISTFGTLALPLVSGTEMKVGAVGVEVGAGTGDPLSST